MTKMHFAADVQTSRTACNRFIGGKTRKTCAATDRVTCLDCRKSGEFQARKTMAKVEMEKALMAQTPRTVRNPWDGKPISCRDCGGQEFRDWGRSLDLNNHKCANCGRINHTMTETGMSA